MNVLVFAPHPDDEMIGCGGTMLKHVHMGDHVFVCIVTRGLPPVYKHSPEILEKLPHDMYFEIENAHRKIGVEKTFYLGFPAVMMETVPRYELNEKIAEVINETKPDIVYMPHFGDVQKDHAVIADAIMVAIRPKYEHIIRCVCAYETLSETEWNIPHTTNAFIPNVYNDITDFLERKISAMECYQSQLADFPNPRSIEAIVALAKYRGSTMCANAAEAFMVIREYR
jgi:LmbE family N-acetylglucosaminyl deacetylase